MRNDDLGDVQGVVLDLDGTVYAGETVIPGAPAVVNRLRSSGFGVRFACALYLFIRAYRT